MINSSAAKAYLFGFVAAFLWGTHSVIVRYLTDHISGMTIAVARLWIAALVLYIILKLSRQPVRITLSNRVLLVTALAVALNFIFFHVGLEYTTASNAMMLENTAPLFVIAFMFLFFREKVRRLEIVASLVAMAGVYLTVRHGIEVGGERLTGDMLELVAGATWAVFMIGSTRVLDGAGSAAERVNFLLNVFVLAAIALTPILLFLPGEGMMSLTATNIVLLVALGVFPTALAFYLWYEAAARVSTVAAALLFTLSIVFTLVNAYLFLGEEMTTDMLAGAALIVAAVVLTKLGSVRG